MSKRNSCKLALILLALVIAGGLAGAAAAPQDLPEGKGVEIARDRCLNCHEADLIVAQKLTRAGWVREVDKMIRWGAIVKDNEKDVLVEYFTAHFAPHKPAATNVANEARGKEIYEAKCLLCHEDDIVRQQRLTRAGWVREVDKMIRWGAVVKDDEKEPLVAYLFKHYGPRPFVGTR
jgi:cytochrome c5